MEKFEFKLHPRNYCFDNDDKVIFTATKVEDGMYKVEWDEKWNSEEDFGIDVDETFTYYLEEAVLRNVAEGDWIVQQEDTLN